MSTRDALIAAAATLLDEGGVEAITLRAVAARVGVSHNAPYRHFADKEALLAAIAAREFESQSLEVLAGWNVADSPHERLRRMARGYLRWALKRPARFKLAFARRADDATLSGQARRSAELFTRAAAEAQEDGFLAEGQTERIAALILAVAHGAADLALAGLLDRSLAARPEVLVEDILALLGESDV